MGFRRRNQLGGKDLARDAHLLAPFLDRASSSFQAKVSDDDTTPNYLSDKITSADASVVITVLNDGADEDLDLSVAVYVAAEIATHTSDPNAHHNQSHVLATASGLGADHTVSGLTAGHVLRATGATTAAFGALQATDLAVHVLATTSGLGSQHSVSGLTAGQVLRATGSTTAAFASLQATDLPSHVLATNTALGSQHTISGATAGHVLRASGATTAAFAQLQHSDLGGVGANDHHNQSHVLATTSALGPDHTVSGLTAGQVLKATGATAARFIQLLHSELGSIGANDHHNQSHVLASTSGLGADHTVSGLTARQVLVATGATTALFRAIESADLPTGATLSVSSTNSGNSHAITSSNAVSSATAVLLATDSNGRVQVQGLGVGTASTGTGVLDVLTKVYINDTAEANVTTGLVINQGTADNGIISLKSSEVAHGMTDYAETDTYGYFGKSGDGDGGAAGSAAGGLIMRGFRDADGVASRAVVVAGYLGEAADTSTTLGTTGSFGVVNFTSGVKSGTGIVPVGDDGNAVTFSNFGDTNWIQKGNGTVYQRGGLLINDDANAFATLGLTINQGANDDDAFSLKSSDVAHGVTGVMETDTYFAIRKVAGADGGAQIGAVTEAAIAFLHDGIATTEGTGKTSSAAGNIIMRARLKSGTSAGDHGANANLFIVRNNGTNKMIVDTEGELHLDATVAANAWDTYDDMALLHGLRADMMPEGHELRRRFGHFMEYARDVLSRTGAVTYNDDGHHYIAIKTMMMLTIDAMRQMNERVDGRIAAIEQKLLEA